jgi:hypothetical protein
MAAAELVLHLARTWDWGWNTEKRRGVDALQLVFYVGPLTVVFRRYA